MKDKKFLVLSSFFFILFIATMAMVAFDRPASTIIRAKTATISPLKSFVIVFPQVGVAGKEGESKQPTKIKVSAYLRDINGNVMPGKSLKLSTLPTTIISPSETQTTNNIGMVQFFVSSEIPAKVQLNVLDVASNTNIANIPTIEFTE